MSVEQRLDLDLEAFNLDAIKRSAYRFSNKFAFDVSVDGRAARCTLIFSEGDARLGIARDSRQRNPGSSETYPELTRIAKSPALSVKTDKSKAKAEIDQKLRARVAAELTTSELQSWYCGMVPATEDRERQRRAQSTADRTRRVFFAALNHAYRNRHDAVPSADAWRAVRSFRNFDRPRRRFLSIEEARRLLNAAPTEFRCIARGALYTGFRLGELLALRVADVVDGQVHVRHSKAGRGRTVPLSADGAEFFEQLTAGRPGDAPVFVRDSGAEWTRMQVSRSMQRSCAAAKIAPRAIFHDLRRSYGSLLLNAGANVDVIQELLGHADMRMTRRVYAHLLNATIANTVKSKLPSFGLEKSNVRKLRP